MPSEATHGVWIEINKVNIVVVGMLGEFQLFQGLA